MSTVPSAQAPAAPKNTQPLWADQYPALSRKPIATDYLHEQKYFDLEREKIFRKCWLYVGRVEEIPSPNGFMVADIEICNASVLIVKDQQGKLSAFHNICKHRLNKLTYEKSGSAGSFVCHYHAWAYDRKGKLRRVPDEEAFYGLDKSTCDLTGIAIDEWRGLIFICLDPSPRQSLREYLEVIPEKLEQFPFERLTAAVHAEKVLEVNWKTGAHTNMESYHAEQLHNRPTLFEPDFSGNPGGRPIHLQLFDRHRMYSYGGREHVKFANPTPLFLKMRECAPMPQFPGTNVGNKNKWVGDNWFIFPNLLLGTMHGNLAILQYWPLAVNRSRFKYTWYYKQPETIREAFGTKLEYVRQVNVLAGDMWAGDRVQEGLATGAAKTMVLGDSEICIRHEHEVYMRELGLA